MSAKNRTLKQKLAKIRKSFDEPVVPPPIVPGPDQMTYQEFVESLCEAKILNRKELIKWVHKLGDYHYNYSTLAERRRIDKERKELGDDEILLLTRWISGGVTGGSCWGDDTYDARQGEPEPEIVYIDEILERYYPTITYLQYKKIAPLIKRDSDDVNEYYGNSTMYGIKYIKLKDFYEFLISSGSLKK